MAEAGAPSPSEIAREVLRTLAAQRLPPTPENFESVYHRIAGTQPEESFPERQLKLLAQALPRSTTEQLRVAQRFEAALGEGSWNGFRAQLATLLAPDAEEPPAWGGLIRELLNQWERRQAGLPSVRKQEALSQVLEGTTDPQLLFSRLQGLLKGWAQTPPAAASEPVEALPEAATPVPATVPVTTSPPQPLDDEWRELFAQLLENAVGMLLIDAPQLADEARELARLIRTPAAAEPAAFDQRLRDFGYKVQWIAQDQSYIRQALLNILHLIIENIGELVVDDKWLSGQMSVVLDLFSRPLDKQVLEELGERLRDVIYKQGTLKRNLSEAQTRLREMLAHFIDRLAELADSTGQYHNRMESFAQRVSTASSMDELTDVISEVLGATRNMESQARSSQQELLSLRSTVDQAHREIQRLEGELEQASAMVRHDPLTGALNRKGLDEMLARETARMHRRKSPLCLALLDVDNFKQLNDTFGHTTGDDALKHLAMVIRENLRPQDCCARYGGEEFVVLLPDTLPADAVAAMRRLQRELTKRFFLHRNKKLLITFSAGVTRLGEDETAEAAIDRADKAMYSAKKAGKNRVELAEAGAAHGGE